MKKVLLTAVSLAMMGGAALAADLPWRKAEPLLPPPPPPMWTGFYAGLNVGYGWGINSNPTSNLLNVGSWSVTTRAVPRDTFTDGNSFLGNAFVANIGSMTQSGFIGGGQFGYNYQHENLVFGFEADFQGTAFRGNSTGYGALSGTSNYGAPAAGSFGVQNGAFLNTISAGLDYLGNARGRIGYLVRPNLLVYGTGGVAYGGAWADAAISGSSTLTPYAYATGEPTAPYPAPSQSYLGGRRSNSLLVGYSAGGGAEWALTENWSIKTEAIYYNLGA